MDLNVDVKYTPSKTAICFIISKHYFCKMEFYCVVSISQAKSIIGQRGRRNTCIHVQFNILHYKLSWISHIIVVYAVGIKEMTIVDKCPVFSTVIMKACWSSSLTRVIIICLPSISYKISTTVYIQRIWSWISRIWLTTTWTINHNYKSYSTIIH